MNSNYLARLPFQNEFLMSNDQNAQMDEDRQVQDSQKSGATSAVSTDSNQPI